MSEALFFIAIGVMLLIALLLLSLPYRDRATMETIQNFPEPAAFPLEVPPENFAKRLFECDDCVFVASLKSQQLTRVFSKQRKALALSWIRAMRCSTADLIEQHLAAARTSAELEPLSELKLTAEYLAFEMLCGCVALFIRLRGPVGLTRWAGHIGALAERLSQVRSVFFSTRSPDKGTATSSSGSP